MAMNGWVTVKIPGGRFLQGFPDIFATHRKYGIRLIETKVPVRGKLSDSQIAMIRKLAAHGTKVYVLHDERDYDKLFLEPNWLSFALGHTDIRMPKGIIPTRGRADRLDQ